jgi:short-subunit dehydrogenase
MLRRAGERFSGRTAIVTGASRGLGGHIARRLAGEGACIVGCARSGSALCTLVDDLRAGGARAIAVEADVRQPDALRALVARAREAFGGIDIVVSNAGIDSYTPFHLRDEAEIEEHVRVNLTATLLLTRMVLPDMLARGRGHIVVMSSLAGRFGLPYGEVYAAAKAGLVTFVHSIRAAYRGTGVSASVILPGFVEEGMYTRLKQASGLSAPPLIGTSPPGAVADAVVRAIRLDKPEIIVSPRSMRLALAAAALFPGLLQHALRRATVDGLFKRSAGV